MHIVRDRRPPRCSPCRCQAGLDDLAPIRRHRDLGWQVSAGISIWRRHRRPRALRWIPASAIPSPGAGPRAWQRGGRGGLVDTPAWADVGHRDLGPPRLVDRWQRGLRRRRKGRSRDRRLRPARRGGPRPFGNVRVYLSSAAGPGRNAAHPVFSELQVSAFNLAALPRSAISTATGTRSCSPPEQDRNGRASQPGPGAHLRGARRPGLTRPTPRSRPAIPRARRSAPVPPGWGSQWRRVRTTSWSALAGGGTAARDRGGAFRSSGAVMVLATAPRNADPRRSRVATCSRHPARSLAGSATWTATGPRRTSRSASPGTTGEARTWARCASIGARGRPERAADLAQHEGFGSGCELGVSVAGHGDGTVTGTTTWWWRRGTRLADQRRYGAVFVFRGTGDRRGLRARSRVVGLARSARGAVRAIGGARRSDGDAGTPTSSREHPLALGATQTGRVAVFLAPAGSRTRGSRPGLTVSAPRRSARSRPSRTPLMRAK